MERSSDITGKDMGINTSKMSFKAMPSHTVTRKLSLCMIGAMFRLTGRLSSEALAKH